MLKNEIVSPQAEWFLYTVQSAFRTSEVFSLLQRGNNFYFQGHLRNVTLGSFWVLVLSFTNFYEQYKYVCIVFHKQSQSPNNMLKFDSNFNHEMDDLARPSLCQSLVRLTRCFYDLDISTRTINSFLKDFLPSSLCSRSNKTGPWSRS